MAAQIPPDIASALRRIGAVIDPAATAALYAPLHRAKPDAGVKLTRDRRYGADPRHRLDTFAPGAAGAIRPVLVFVHGGGFTGGERRSGDSPFYDNILRWAVANGMVGVNMTYRLAPAHGWPAAQQDIGAALAWVRQNIGAEGGDPSRIFLMGHSAGATHVAQYLAHPQFHTSPAGGIAGAVLLSGLIDTASAEQNSSFHAYFGADPQLQAERSALPGLLHSPVPLLLAYAELDPPEFHQQSERVHATLRAAGIDPPLLKLAGHSHMSEVYAINTADAALTGALSAFVASLR